MFQDPATRYEQCPRAGIFQDELNLVDRLSRVDGNSDRADAQNREVNNRPFGAIFGN